MGTYLNPGNSGFTGIRKDTYMDKTVGSNELEFAIFCIENIANALDKNAKEVYEMLTTESNILYEYIIPEYEMLHTQSKAYIVNDILAFMRESGVIV